MVNIDSTMKAFNEMLVVVEERLTAAEAAKDLDGTKNSQREYDLINEVLFELGSYDMGVTLDFRDKSGILTGKTDRYFFEWLGNKYVYYRVRRRPEPEEGWNRWGWHCRFICGMNYARPHFTCVRGCWGNKIWFGHMPPAMDYETLNMVVYTHRPWWKKWAARCVCTILEWLTS